MNETRLAKRLKNMDESATLSLNARAKALVSEGSKINNLTAGELSSATPNFIQQAVSTKLAENKYTSVAGMMELRESIARDASKQYRLDWIESKNVVVTAGAKPALFATLMALINPGDEVILPVPAWVSYIHLIELAGGIVVGALRGPSAWTQKTPPMQMTYADAKIACERLAKRQLHAHHLKKAVV